MVLHDLNLAARYSDLIVVMKDGRDRRPGHAGRGLHPEPCSAAVFGLEADVLADPRTGLPIVVPTSSRGDGVRQAR